jgi:hypothetical protein
VKTFTGKTGFEFLDEREYRLRSRWFHYSTLEVYSQFFRSPDWRLWQHGRYEDSVQAMLEGTDGIARNRARAQVWADAGVQVVRAQVIDADAAARIDHPVNYLLTYLAATHPDEDQFVVDSAKTAAVGLELPELDFLIHDDDLVMTKYEGQSGRPQRDLYRNTPPDPGEDDDRPFFTRCRHLADQLLKHRAEITRTGDLPGLALLGNVRARLVEPAGGDR